MTNAWESGGLRFVRADAITSHPIRWLSRGRLALGKLTDLAGQQGVGKSLIAVDFIARLSRGVALPGGEPGKPPGAVVINLEDAPDDTIKPRLIATGADLSRVAIVDIEGGGLQAHMPQIEAVAREVAAKLISIDPVMATLGHANSYKDAEEREALVPVTAMLRRLDAAGMMHRHANKAQSSDPFTRTSASIAFSALARLALLGGQDPDDPDRYVLAPYKSNISARAPSLVYRICPDPANPDVATVEWLGETSIEASQLLDATTSHEERGTLAEAVSWLQHELARGMRPATDVIKAAARDGISERTLRRARERLGIHPHRINESGSSRGQFY